MKPGKNWVSNKIPPNQLKYLIGWKEGLLIWSITEMVNFLFIRKLVGQNNLEITLKIMKKYLEIY